ncbi:MAG: hypothetical protein JWP06_130 [Candidatus Saccharibacteria bacterium]|nr:hypothetical protein [Candidatus Saccharibacteria bacterium]
MTQKTNTDSPAQTPLQEQLLVASPLSHDVKNAVLIVSVVANLIVLTTWIAIQVTSQYDVQLARLLFNS